MFFSFKANIDNTLQLNFDMYKTFVMVTKWLSNLMTMFFRLGNLNFTSLATMTVVICLFSLVKRFLFNVIYFVAFELIIQSFRTFSVFIETFVMSSGIITIHADSASESSFCVVSAVLAVFPSAGLSRSVLDCFLIHFLFSSVFNHWRHLFLRWSFLLQWKYSSLNFFFFISPIAGYFVDYFDDRCCNDVFVLIVQFNCFELF